MGACLIHRNCSVQEFLAFWNNSKYNVWAVSKNAEDIIALLLFTSFLENGTRYLSKLLAFSKWERKRIHFLGPEIFCGNKNLVFSQSLGKCFNQI